MLPSALWLLCLAAVGGRAQDSTTSSPSQTSSSASSSSQASNTYDEFSFTNSFSVIQGGISTVLTGSDYTYAVVTGQRTVGSSSATETGTSNSTTSTSSNSQITVSTKSVSVTQLVGSTANSTNATASSTSTAARPTNTVPCNGFPEFCSRKYSNITMVTAHNAAFVVKNNAASNQDLPILDQLNDGIRMLSGEVHWVNNTLWNCHTNCNILNAGTWQSELETVRGWLEDNPYDVLTILIVNSDFTDVENYVPAITNAGLLPYVYEPAYVPQYRDQWPTLGEMIITGKRLVFMMDYDADQSRVPYILDEFTHMWETPFSPQNQSFPCTQQRPPNLNQTVARDQYMYLANHNLNQAIDLSSLGITTSEEILIPNTAELNLTNSQENVFGALGAMNNNCTADWGRPPNFLLVDYYNRGSPEMGSVFHVAAAANGVTYTQKCCGLAQSAAPRVVRGSMVALAAAVFAGVLVAW